MLRVVAEHGSLRCADLAAACWPGASYGEQTTGQPLFYMGETNLQHLALAIAEEEGAHRAVYVLRG
ncbi:hypothetical protein [Pelomonas cellulosilytica]|uniref:RES domain-containing protein n=1 Tax=Pelomonas cellulosilytica TaxID=2906762 RepID=A0ABS8Y0Q1_9BURK|nr:hypothetical protein [Pelomonas sp. P8]MCE4557858.1 hypothetical protein [Pelomonas sp. P8]